MNTPLSKIAKSFSSSSIVSGVFSRTSLVKTTGKQLKPSFSYRNYHEQAYKSPYSEFKSLSEKNVFPFAIGAGVLSVGLLAAMSNQADAEEDKKIALNPKEFVGFKLKEVTKVNHNTKVYRFELPSEQHELGMKVASCILVKVPGGEKDGKDAIRPYTPITLNEQKGYFDLMVKVYPNGAGSQHINNLKVGEELLVKGPFTTYEYKPNSKKHIGMIAGGTGITPMLQICREIFKNSNDNTKVTVVFANIAEEDILLKKELDEMQKKYKNFDVHYVLEKAPSNWKGDIGYVTPDIIKKFMPAPTNDNLVVVCGPPPMIEKISGSKNKDYTQGEVKGMLKDLGYTSTNVHKF